MVLLRTKLCVFMLCLISIKGFLIAENELSSQTCYNFDECRAEPCRPTYPLIGGWLPESCPFFPHFMADPREITYSVGWRFHDQVLENNIIDVSFADALPIYQWWNVWKWKGTLRIELEGALWAVFDPCHESSPLIDADYYVGIPITYGIGRWSARLRLYHISTHMGDEFLVENLPKGFERLNPSAEYLDLFISNYITDDIRLYAGVGAVLEQDESFRCGRYFIEGGAEVHLAEVQYVNKCSKFYAMPIFGMHFRYKKDFKNHVDATYILGYEIGKLYGLCRKLRVYMEYHDGYSLEGQFSKRPTSYFSLRTSYGY